MKNYRGEGKTVLLSHRSAAGMIAALESMSSKNDKFDLARERFFRARG